ncbi:hypothetical protein [Actinokineospora enzanensis]|uniref:hypothetical protein n=1 Tax=Actinokineospora enzanensis TaxID=155975 RepID=UPI0003646CFA|nr:hypothetical protein [Actinokineospora enzanensis]
MTDTVFDSPSPEQLIRYLAEDLLPELTVPESTYEADPVRSGMGGDPSERGESR